MGTNFAVLNHKLTEAGKNRGGISANWNGYSRYTKLRTEPRSCLEDLWNVGNPEIENPIEAGSWNWRNGNSRNRQTKISRSSSGKKNDPMIKIVSFKELISRQEVPSMKLVTVYHENNNNDKKVKRPVAWLVVGRGEKNRVGNLLEVGRNVRKTVSSYSTPRCFPDRF